MNRNDQQASSPSGWSHRTDSKADIIKAISARLGIPKIQAGSVVEEFLNGIAESLRDGRRVEIRGFGVFETVERAARPAFDINKGEPLDVPARVVARFRPGRQLAALVARLAGREEAA